MTLGSRTRRAAPGFAFLTIVALSGCHAMPVASMTPSPNRPQSVLASASRATLLSATVAMDPPSEMSSIEPVPSRLSTLTLADAPPDGAPTPLLDAALEKAKGMDEFILGETPKSLFPPVTIPTPVPPPSQATPPADHAVVAVALPTQPSPTSAPAESAPEPKPKEKDKEKEKEKDADPPRPEELWRDGIRRLGTLARAKFEQPGGSVSPWGLRTRVLAWLAEPDIDPDLGQHEADGVRAVLRVLDDAPTGSPRRGADVRSAVTVLEDKAPLEITDLRLCSKVERFGDFEAFDPPVRKAGQPVILYCEVDGLKFEETSAGFRTRTAAQLEIFPEGGGSPVLSRTFSPSDEVCRRRRRDYFIAYRLVLPKPLAPGDYRLRLTTRDLTADRSTSREVSFAIAKD